MTISCVFACSAGLSQEAQENIHNWWLEHSSVSPSKDDTIRKKDNRGQLVLLEEINSDEKYEEVQKRYYTDTDGGMWLLWQYQNTDLLYRERLSKGQPIISKRTFTKYRPNWVDQTNYLSQFACDKCIEFEWMHDGLMKTLKDNHSCGLTTCNNYQENMSTKCICDNCSTCFISELKAAPVKQLLHYLCCDNENEPVPFLDCVSGECDFRPCFSDMFKLLFAGDECTTLNVEENELIPYYALAPFKVHDKTKKCRAATSLSWSNFKRKYVEKLEDYLLHRYNKEWQETRRDIITKGIDFEIVLPEDVLFGSFDFGGNIICNYKMHPHQGSMFELSILAIHEVANINVRICKKKVILTSNEPSHGWHSAVPAYSKYLELKQQQFRRRGKHLKTHVLWSDRGPSDFWNGPFMVYAIDIGREKSIGVHMNTTPVGHGKYTHDQIIGLIKGKASHGFKEDLIAMNTGDSIAGKTISWLSLEFPEYEFIEVPLDDIIVANSPLKSRLLTKEKKGVKSYHCLHSSHGVIKFRKLSCYCNLCLSSGFVECSKGIYCGDWVDCDDKDHPAYETLIPKAIANKNNNPRKRRRLSNDSNHNNRG